MISLLLAVLVAQSTPLACAGEAMLTPCEEALWRAGVIDAGRALACGAELKSCRARLVTRTSTAIASMVPLPLLADPIPEVKEYRWLDLAAIGAVGMGVGLLVGAYVVRR